MYIQPIEKEGLGLICSLKCEITKPIDYKKKKKSIEISYQLFDNTESKVSEGKIIQEEKDFSNQSIESFVYNSLLVK